MRCDLNKIFVVVPTDKYDDFKTNVLDKCTTDAVKISGLSESIVKTTK